MRRAIVATAGTVVGLVALLSYKSSGPHNLQRVQFNGGQAAPASSTVPPATTAPSGGTGAGGSGPGTNTPATTSPATTSPATTSPATTAPPVTASAERTYAGQDIQYLYGDIVVNATLQGGRILNVSVPQNNATDGRSQMINSYAVPILEQEAVAAQGVNINVVSGATFTSDAFAQSLQSALSQAGEMTANTGGIGIVHQEVVMGTVVTFDVVTASSTAEIEAALRAAVTWLHRVDSTFSTYKPDSEVCRFDRGELELDDCSPELRHVFALCHRFNDETDGFFDAWAGGSFDPSGVVKGWSIEEASRLLADAGLPDHLIDGGGDVRLRGRPGPDEPWHVGVRHPLQRDAYCATLLLGDGAVATSGTYERGPHVINPFTGQPAIELVSATVVGPDLTVADAYATAALVMGVQAPAWLGKLTGYDALIIGPDGRGWSTPGWPA